MLKKQNQSNKQKTIKKRRVDALISWKIQDFEENKKNFRFMAGLYSAIFILAVYGLITNNLLLSILLILFGFTFFIFENKKPRTMIFAVTKEGIFIHDHLYSYNSLESFWIEYEPESLQELSFKTNQLFLPFLKIPLKKTNPVELRKCLIKFLPEKKHPHSFNDLIERL